jgi:hypothetical protein
MYVQAGFHLFSLHAGRVALPYWQWTHECHVVVNAVAIVVADVMLLLLSSLWPRPR